MNCCDLQYILKIKFSRKVETAPYYGTNCTICQLPFIFIDPG